MRLLFGNMRVTRLESLEPITPQSRAQPINQSRDFHFTDTAALQIQLHWGKRFGSRDAQSHPIEAKARIERIIETVDQFPKQSYHHLCTTHRQARFGQQSPPHTIRTRAQLLKQQPSSTLFTNL